MEARGPVRRETVGNGFRGSWGTIAADAVRSDMRKPWGGL